jgi:hypothetical protein
MILVIRYVDFVCNIPLGVDSIDDFINNLSKYISAFINDEITDTDFQFRTELPFFSKEDLRNIFQAISIENNKTNIHSFISFNCYLMLYIEYFKERSIEICNEKNSNDSFNGFFNDFFNDFPFDGNETETLTEYIINESSEEGYNKKFFRDICLKAFSSSSSLGNLYNFS